MSLTRRQLDYSDIAPGSHVALRHPESGMYRPCIVVRLADKGRTANRVVVSCPSHETRYSDGTKKPGWTKPKAVSITDLFSITEGEVMVLAQFEAKVARCPHLPT